MCAKLRLRRSCRAISSLFNVVILIYYLRGCNSLILLSGYIKTNPGPTPSSQQYFSICHWNLNSITAHNLAKLFLLTAYNLVHSFDIICLSDTYLNFKAPPNDTRLELPGYNLFRSDHPSNNKEEVFVVITNRPLLEMNLDALSTNNPFFLFMFFITSHLQHKLEVSVQMGF